MKVTSCKKIKTTKKNHRCSRCQMIIPKGSSVLYKSFKLEGNYYNEYSHIGCGYP